jgi:multiple sugar transport system permease protein
MKPGNKRLFDKSITYLLLIVIGLMMCFPFYWLVRSSVMSRGEIFSMPIVWWPSEFHFENYFKAFTAVDFPLYFKNTLILVGLNVVGVVFSNSFIAFGFSRIQFRTRDFWFGLVLATMMIPGIVLFIPQFIFWKEVGGYDTYFPLALPAFFGASFYTFLLRQFYTSIPKDYDEAAVVDGANFFQIYYKLILPMSTPALMTVGLFTFMGVWNDYIGPTIYLSSEEKWNLSLGLRSFLGTYSKSWELLLAGATITILPLMIVFFFAQKKFIEGANLTGVKG